MEISEHRLASVSRPVAQAPATDSPRWERRSVKFEEPEIAFPKLNLRRDRATRVVVFDLAPMREQLRRNGLTMEAIYELSQEGLRDLLLAWYIECVGRGGQCSAEITAAVREMRAETPTYSVVIRPVCNVPEGVTPAQALKPRHEPATAAVEGKKRVGLFAAIKANYRDFLREEGDIEVEKPYEVPSGPALHLRPVRFRQSGLKEA
jgi:hypothetical protein